MITRNLYNALVQCIYLDLLFILKSSLADNDVFYPPPVTKPLLKHSVVLEELLCLLFGDPVQSIFVDDSDTFKLKEKNFVDEVQ